METTKIDTGWYGNEGFVVRVGTGDESNSYFLHRGYACYSSMFFEDLYTEMKRAVIEVDFSTEDPGTVYHFAHWLYPKFLPLLAEQNQSIAIVEVVNRLFVFAEKYWIHELATECYKKIRMLLAPRPDRVMTAEQLKGLYDVHAEQSSMMKIYYLRLMAQRYSVEEDVLFFVRCFQVDPGFAMDFLTTLQEHLKSKRAHPNCDKDLESYLLPPRVGMWGESRVVSATDDAEADERKGDQEVESIGPDEPQQNGTVGAATTRRRADGMDMDGEYLDHVAERHFDSVAQIDFTSSLDRDRNKVSAKEPALETDARNSDREANHVALNQPQQNGTSEAPTPIRASQIPRHTPFDSPHGMEQDNMSTEEPVAREPGWIIENHEQNHDRVVTLHVPTHPLRPTEAFISSPGAPGHTPLPHSALTGPNASIQENGVGSASHPNHSDPQGSYFQFSPRHTPSIPRSPSPLRHQPAPLAPLTGAELAAQILGYQAAYPAVQSFLKELVLEPSVADLYRVQDILIDNPVTRTDFSLLKALFDPGGTLSNYPPMPLKQPKRKGRPPKIRKTFPGELTIPPAPVPQRRPPIGRKSGPSQTTRSWGSEEYQNGESDEEVHASARVRTRHRAGDKEKEKEKEPRPRRSVQRQSSGPRERKRMWDDFKIEN